MARHEKRLLLTLSALLISLFGYSQAVTFSSVDELRAYGAPTAKDGYKPAVSVITRNRQIIYFWNDSCRHAGDSMMHIRPVGVVRGCWEQVTGNTAIAVNGLARKDDTFYVDTTIARKASLDSFKTAVGNWALTMQTSSQAQTSNANLQFQIDNKADKAQLGKYADTSMLKSAFGFIEGQVDSKADYDYVNASAQALRIQDSTEIAGKADKDVQDSILVLIAGFPATFNLYLKLSQYEADKATTADLIEMIKQKAESNVSVETDPVYNSEKGQYLLKRYSGLSRITCLFAVIASIAVSPAVTLR